MNKKVQLMNETGERVVCTTVININMMPPVLTHQSGLYWHFGRDDDQLHIYRKVPFVGQRPASRGVEPSDEQEQVV